MKGVGRCGAAGLGGSGGCGGVVGTSYLETSGDSVIHCRASVGSATGKGFNDATGCAGSLLERND